MDEVMKTLVLNFLLKSTQKPWVQFSGLASAKKKKKKRRRKKDSIRNSVKITDYEKDCWRRPDNKAAKTFRIK